MDFHQLFRDLLIMVLYQEHSEGKKRDGARGGLSRYGGDEFACLFENTEREQAFMVIEGVQAAIEALEKFSNGDTTIKAKVTITGGVAAYPIDGSDENELFRKADGALYRAKMTGRNKFVLAVEERMLPNGTK